MYDNVAIVGVGLIGASIGLALKSRRLARRIVGVSRSQGTVDLAKSLGAIDVGATAIGSEMRSAELAIVCSPVDRIAEHVQLLAKTLPESALITDVGSTKSRIVASVPPEHGKATFIGSHPLAGSHQSGPAAADANLFAGKVCVVTPTESSEPDRIAQVRHFWESVDMTVVTMSAAVHDEIVARTSHLPHLAAYALALSVSPTDLPLAASGFRDTTRLAASGPSLWSAILLENRGAVLDAVDVYLLRLGRIRDAIDGHDAAELEQLLSDAKRTRDSLGD